MNPYFVSFYPRIPMEENLSVFDSLDDPSIRKLLNKAAGILLPSYISPWRYYDIIRLTSRWFPRLEARSDYLGKAKQILLFRQLGVRYPETLLFEAPSQLMVHFLRCGSPWGYPVVLKGDTGGGGNRVYPIYEPSDIRNGRIEYDSCPYDFSPRSK